MEIIIENYQFNSDYLIFISNSLPKIKRKHPKDLDSNNTKNYSAKFANNKELPILQAGFNVNNLKSAQATNLFRNNGWTSKCIYNY